MISRSPAPFIALVLVAFAVPSASAARPCAPSPPPAGPTVQVSNSAELLQAVRDLSSGETILIADGSYDLSNTLHLFGGLSDVAIRGESGDREAVVLRGLGMSNPNYGNVPHGILISDASDVLIADLTIRDVWYVSDRSDGDRTRLAESPPAIGVTSCSEPTPATGPACRDVGVVGRASNPHYYRVRSTCGAAAEGP